MNLPGQRGPAADPAHGRRRRGASGLGLLATLGGLLGGAGGCERETHRIIVVVHPAPVDPAGTASRLPSSARAILTLTLGGRATSAPQEWDATQTALNLQLPDGSQGELGVALSLSDCHRCQLGSGHGTVMVSGNGRYDVTVPLMLLKAAQCPSGLLLNERYDYFPVPLTSGLLLLAGGSARPDTTAPVTATELHDPATGISVPAATLMRLRTGIRTAVLRSGQVLFAGGDDGGYVATCELYDPLRDRFALTGAMQTRRGDHALTGLADGRVLAVGGTDSNSYLRSAEVYDPGSQLWTPVDDALFAHRSATATLLADGRVLVAGGSSDYQQYPLTAELFDPLAAPGRQWTAAGTLGTGRAGHRALPLPGGKVLLLGGGNAGGDLQQGELYDSTAAPGNQFSPAGRPGSPLSLAAITGLTDGRVVVAGGGVAAITPNLQVYDPQRNAFSAGPPLQTARLSATAVALPSGAVLLLGGRGGVDQSPATAAFLTRTETIYPDSCPP